MSLSTLMVYTVCKCVCVCLRVTARATHILSTQMISLRESVSVCVQFRAPRSLCSN